MINRNKDFNLLLTKIKLPIIFSLMAMLSNDKVNLFNDNFISFAQFIMTSTVNKTHEDVLYSAFIID